MSTLILVRHAEAHYRAPDGSYVPDGGLTGPGMRQAHALADAFRDRPRASLVLCSPALRTRQTAALAGLTPQPCDDLAEWGYRPYQHALAAGRPEADDPWWIWEQATRWRPDHTETLEQLTHRADRVLGTATAAVGEGGEAVLISHGHLLRVLAVRWLGLPAHTAAHLQIRPGSIAQLAGTDDRRSIATWNVPGCLAHRPVTGDDHCAPLLAGTRPNG